MTFCEQYYALYVRCADNQERILAVFFLNFLMSEMWTMWCINTSIELSIILFDIPFSTFYAVKRGLLQ